MIEWRRARFCGRNEEKTNEEQTTRFNEGRGYLRGQAESCVESRART